MLVKRALRGDRVHFGVLLALLVWLPVPLGSNRVWSWSLVEMVIYLLAAAWVIGHLLHVGGAQRSASSSGSSSRDVKHHGYPAFSAGPLRFARSILLLWGVWILYLSVYLIPWPESLVTLLSPNVSDALSQVNRSSTVSPGYRLSLSAYDSSSFWMKSLAWGLLFALTLVLARTRDRVRWLAAAIVTAGLIQAVWGGLEALANPGGIATGGFVNRNHLAGFLEMCLAVGIGLLIAQLGGRSVQGWRNRLGAFFDLLLSPKAILRLALVVMVIALVLTRSRMGNIAFFSSLLIAGSVALVFSRHATRSTVILIASLIVIDVFLVGAWFGVDRVVERIEQTVETAEQSPGGVADERQLVFPHVVTMIRDNPLLGTGPGTFYVAFPRYAGSDLVGFYDHAHNDYLQFAAETGVLGVFILGAILLTSLAQALRAQYSRRDPLMRGISFAAMMAMVSLLIHSWVDFNLQIPANAALFVVVLALAWISNQFGREEIRRKGHLDD